MVSSCLDFLFFLLITLGLELSDTKVYEPYIRVLLGTASHYCGAVGLDQVVRNMFHAAQTDDC